jgi:outer membrane protein assembly factor BamB
LEKVPKGNLTFGNGCLIVANEEGLSAFIAPRRSLEQQKREAAAQPKQGAVRYRLALAQADAGQPEAALASFTLAERLAAPAESEHDVPLRDLARWRKHELLLTLADQARAGQHWDDAAGWLARAAAEEFAVSLRLEALSRQVGLWAAAGQPARAVVISQAILTDSALRHGQILGPEGIPQPAALWAAGQIDKCIKGKAAAVYAAFEQRAGKLLETAQGQGRIKVLEKLVSEYPNSATARAAVLQLAHLHEQGKQWGAAADAYRTFLRRSPAETDRATALVGLARAYEAQSCWDAARRSWTALGEAHGNQILADLDAKLTVKQFLARHLQQPMYQSRGNDKQGEPVPPLSRTWEVSLTSAVPEPRREAGQRLLAVATDSALPDAQAYLFLAGPGQLSCRDAGTGKFCWIRSLPHTPRWVGRHADLVVAADQHGIHVLRLADGAILWEFVAAVSPGNPFVRGEDQDGGRLSGFQLAGGRLFAFHDQRRLLAFDVESGQVQWQQWAPGAQLQLPEPAGRFCPFYHAGDDRVVLQTATGQCWVLDSRWGRKLYEGPPNAERWPCPPIAVDERHLCLVPDARHIVLFEPAAGKEAWTYTLDRRPSLSGEPPQVLLHGESLLVLVPRSYGYELQCLDVQTGKPRWPQAPLVSTQRFELGRSATDGEVVYLVHDGSLHARSLADGKGLWERALPLAGTDWQARCRRGLLLAYPLRSQAGPLGTSARHRASVVYYNARDGQPVQALNFAADGPQVGVSMSGRTLAVVLGEMAWGLTAAPRH